MTTEKSEPTSVHALLLLAPGCPHCARELEALGTLVKEGVIGRLEAVNIAAEPETARSLGVRAVPWARIGLFELAGAHTLAELRRWAELAGRPEGVTVYLVDLLTTGRRHTVTELVRKDPALRTRLVELLGDPDTDLNTRVGVMATLEEFHGSDLMAGLAQPLGRLTRHQHPRVRADACHALSLTGSADSLPFLQRCLDDEDAEVRDAAREGIEALRG